MASGGAVNVGTDTKSTKLSFDRSARELKDLKDRNFSFTVEQAEEGQEKIVFMIKNDKDELLRQNISKPFPAGAIKMKSAKLTKSSYTVTVDNPQKLSLSEYIE